MKPKYIREADPLLLREIIKDQLCSEMSEVSENCYCAGWMGDLEYSLWRMLNDPGDSGYGQDKFSDAKKRRIASLAVAADGWWVWQDDGPVFVSLAEWEKEIQADGRGT